MASLGLSRRGHETKQRQKLLVDGLHTEEGTRRDLLQLRAAAACNHVVFIDDLESGRGSDLAMRKMVAAGATAGTLRAHRG